MVFEKNGTKVVVHLGPSKGVWYTKIVRDEYGDDNIDHIYKLTTGDKDWINLTADGWISWEKDSSWHSESDE